MLQNATNAVKIPREQLQNVTDQNLPLVFNHVKFLLTILNTVLTKNNYAGLRVE